MKIAGYFTVSLYLSNVLCIKISTPKTISMSTFVLIHDYFWKMAICEITIPLTYLMKLVNQDIDKWLPKEKKMKWFTT
jgi:hypothetical protein